MNHGLSSSLTSTPVRRRKKTNPPPPPPPLPPPPPPLMCTAVTTIPQRRPLAQRNSSAPDQQLKSVNCRVLLSIYTLWLCYIRKRPAVAMECILGQLKGSGCRKRLKTTLKRSVNDCVMRGACCDSPSSQIPGGHTNQWLEVSKPPNTGRPEAFQPTPH